MWLKRLLLEFDALEVIFILLVVLAGVGIMGYVGVAWIIYWWSSGQIMLLSVAVVVVCLISFFAALRVPVALYAFVGLTVLFGYAFVMGYGSLFMP